MFTAIVISFTTGALLGVIGGALIYRRNVKKAEAAIALAKTEIAKRK